MIELVALNEQGIMSKGHIFRVALPGDGLVL